MFATVILISTLCNVNTVKGDSCDASFDSVWSGRSFSEFKHDVKSCLDAVALYPRFDHIDRNTVVTRDCYIPDYTYEKKHPGSTIVNSATDKDSAFVYATKDLEVK